MKKILIIGSTLIFLFSVNFLFSQSYQFQGSWIKINTTYEFEFDLILNQSSSNQVSGYFLWQIVQYDENSTLSKNHYKDKIGLTAKEYVKGHYNSTKDVFFLKGYKKEDPDNIIGLDDYRLEIDRNGNLSGVTKSNNSWKGRIHGQDISSLVL